MGNNLCYIGVCGATRSGKTTLCRNIIKYLKSDEKHIIHLGFLCKPDNSDKPFSRMGLSADGPSSTYDDNDVFYWFDMSDVISKEKE